MQAFIRRRGRALTSGVLSGRLFVSSYAPLFAILAARSSPRIGQDDEPRWAFVVFVALAAWGLGDALWLVTGARHRGAISISLTDVREQGSAAAGYMPTYLLPFIATTPASIGSWIGYSIYFLVLFVVFLRSDFAVVNPTLYLLGRRVVRAGALRRNVGHPESLNTEEVIVVCRRIPRSGVAIRVTQLRGCWVEKEAVS